AADGHECDDRRDRRPDRLAGFLFVVYVARSTGHAAAAEGRALGRRSARSTPMMTDPSVLNRHKFSAIAHRDHDYCNPISAAKVERFLDLLPLEASSRVLDLGCGRAELALRIIERFGSTVVAVDNSSMMLDAARERADWTGALAKLHLDDIDIREFQADPETFHLSVMLGGGGISGGMAGMCRQLKTWTKCGGYVLIGEGFWRQKPPAEYLALLDGSEGEYLDHRGNVRVGIDAGLIPMHATTAS